jgi:pyruvate ferredoxin oxidoreductase alpha subunit
MHVIESGNTAAAYGVKLARPQVIAAYPITPQTPLTEKLSEFVDGGELDSQYIPVESEHSALSVCIGASSAGTRAFTATSANGLLYMYEQVNWAAGARLPIVMCVANRGLGAPWTIWNDHQDSMSARDTGWIQIYCADHQQIIDSTLQAFRLAETVKIPVMVCYDGFLLSHTYMPFDLPDAETVDGFLPPFEGGNVLDPAAPSNVDTVTLPDVRPGADGKPVPGYMDIRHSLHADMRTAIGELEDIDAEYQKLFGRGGNPLVEPYRCEDAEIIAVSLGSLSYQMRVSVDQLREEGVKMGSAGLRLYRPFPDAAVAELLSGAKRVAVFEKALSYGNQGPLYGDIKAALYRQESRPEVSNFIIGLGGREIKTDQLTDILRDLGQGKGASDDASRFVGIRI